MFIKIYNQLVKVLFYSIVSLFLQMIGSQITISVQYQNQDRLKRLDYFIAKYFSHRFVKFMLLNLKKLLRVKVFFL